MASHLILIECGQHAEALKGMDSYLHVRLKGISISLARIWLTMHLSVVIQMAMHCCFGDITAANSIINNQKMHQRQQHQQHQQHQQINILIDFFSTT